MYQEFETNKKYKSIKILIGLIFVLGIFLPIFLYEYKKMTKERLQVKNLSLVVGDKYKFRVDIDDESKRHFWLSSDENVLIINDDGELNAIGEGIAVVEFYYSGKVEKCNVNVLKLENSISAKKIELSHEEVKTSIGKNIKLTYKLEPGNVTSNSINWYSSNEDIAVVKEGVVYPKKSGEVIITVATTNGKTDACKIIINNNKYNNSSSSNNETEEESISFDKNEMVVNTGEYINLGYKIYPEHSSTNVIWNSSDNNIATIVGDGLLYAKKSGNIVVTATTLNGKKATINIQIKNVNQFASSIELGKSNMNLVVGDKNQLNATIIPNNTTDKTVTWSSNNAWVVSVDNNGLINANNIGTAIITATTSNGKTATITINVLNQEIEVTSIQLNKQSASISVGESLKLIETYTPENATNKTIIWTSSDESVASVEPSGNVIGKKVGNAIITAKSSNGKIASSEIKVISPIIEVKGVALDSVNLSLETGKNVKLTANVMPTNSTNKTITWSSSDESIAVVDSEGNVQTKKAGNVEITARSNNGMIAVSNIVVKSPKIIDVSTISLDKTSLTMNTATTKKIVATVTESNNAKIDWSSSNTSIAIVENGVITAKKEGTVTITAKISNGKSATCKVTVKSVDRIHFIANGDAMTVFMEGGYKNNDSPSPSETILLESNGKFALVDAGLSNGNSLNPNRAKYVVEYLKKLGVKELEFIILTHIHSDHAGGASYIMNKIPTKKLYMKEYYANDGIENDKKQNGLNRYKSLYDLAVSKSSFEKISAGDDGKTISLGKMKVKFLLTKNIMYYDACKGEDENINSIVNYITVNGKKILLTGDVEATTEKCVKKLNSSCTGGSILQCVITQNKISNIDLLKLPHHGYFSGDMNSSIAKKLNPEYIVIGNWSDKIKYNYSGVTNSKGVKLGPRNGSSRSMLSSYFSDYSTSGDKKRAFYVNNRNLVFDFSNSSIKYYNN